VDDTIYSSAIEHDGKLDAELEARRFTSQSPPNVDFLTVDCMQGPANWP
jgi:hypothetical protein